MNLPNPGSVPLKNARHEIYALERAAGLSETDAGHVAGVAWTMLQEPGERLQGRHSIVQRQALRRLDARLGVLNEIQRGLDEVEYREFLLRNKRAIAELSWFRMIVSNSGIEPPEDSNGNLILPTKHKSNGQSAAVTEQPQEHQP
jgi:hypothetical protein